MTSKNWQQIPIKECGELLLDLSGSSIYYEPIYFHRSLSKDSQIFLRESLIQKLSSIDKELAPHYKLKVWDGWRSRETQKNIYQKYWNDLVAANPKWNDEKLKSEVGKFVASPSIPNRIPPHSTGGAIDLTLVDHLNNELPMGTVFDHFGPEAATTYDKLTKEEKHNRSILVAVMTKYGFANYPNEWWHWGFGDQLSAMLQGQDHAIYGEITRD